MHEMAVTQSVLDIAQRHASRAGAKRIVAINLVVGELTGFVQESIQFYFDFLSQDGPAAGAALNVERIAPRARCTCGAEYAPPDSRVWSCPVCGALGGEVIAGREFFVESIEVE